MEKIYLTTSDMYEAGLYYSLEYKLEKVDVIKENRKRMGKFVFSGDEAELKKLRLAYFNGSVEVNLMDFRRAYHHLNSLLGSAKKEAIKEAQKLAKAGGKA